MKEIKTIDSLWLFIVAVLFLGPFALPLLWRNPRYSKKIKIISSLAVILFTVLLVIISNEAMQRIYNQYDAILEMTH